MNPVSSVVGSHNHGFTPRIAFVGPVRGLSIQPFPTVMEQVIAQRAAA